MMVPLPLTSDHQVGGEGGGGLPLCSFGHDCNGGGLCKCAHRNYFLLTIYSRT